MPWTSTAPHWRIPSAFGARLCNPPTSVCRAGSAAVRAACAGEVAALSHMSTDYYARLERGRGPQPSEQMIGSIAQGLHLTLPECDHLYRLAGHTPPTSASGTTQHIAPGMLRILDRLDDTPAEIVTELGETLRQTRVGVALVGDLTR